MRAEQYKRVDLIDHYRRAGRIDARSGGQVKYSGALNTPEHGAYMQGFNEEKQRSFSNE